MLGRRRARISIALAAGVLSGGCNGGSGSPDASSPDAEPVRPGRLVMSWTLVDGEEALSCEDVGAVSVSFTSIPLDGFAGEVRSRACSAGEEGVTFELSPGAYTGRVELVSVAGVIGEPVRLDRIDLESDQEVVLDPITFDIPATGGASFRVEARPFDDNCGDEDSPPIEELTIELLDRDGACVPVTFEIGDGSGEAAESYESDCAGASIGCVERDQTISFAGVTPDRYLLDILARDESGACLGILHQFEVAGGGLIAPLGGLVLDELESCSDPQPDAGVPDAGGDLDAGVPDAGGDLDAGDSGGGGA